MSFGDCVVGGEGCEGWGDDEGDDEGEKWCV